MIVVTRHDGLVDYLQSEGYIGDDCDVIEHADVDDVRGQKTIGFLPVHLAAEAEEHTEVRIEYPPDYRGEELDESKVRKYATGVVTYDIKVVDEDEV